MWSLLWAGAMVIAAPEPTPEQPQLPTARDHRGNQIEPFRQVGPFGGGGSRIRACTGDRSLCAELIGRLRDGVTLRLEEQAGSFSQHTRSRDFPLSQELLTSGGANGYTLDDIVIREPRGSIMIALDLSKEAGRRPGFYSYQRRLLLLRIAPEEGAVPIPVLHAPLSGVVEEPVCPYPPQVETNVDGTVSGAWLERKSACQNQYHLSTLVTLLPSIAPVEPPNLIIVVTAETSPGRRTRSAGAHQREPIARTGDDIVRDPSCSYTRSFYFDEALGHYEPEAPLPRCPDFLEP